MSGFKDDWPKAVCSTECGLHEVYLAPVQGMFVQAVPTTVDTQK